MQSRYVSKFVAALKVQTDKEILRKQKYTLTKSASTGLFHLISYLIEHSHVRDYSKFNNLLLILREGV